MEPLIFSKRVLTLLVSFFFHRSFFQFSLKISTFFQTVVHMPRVARAVAEDAVGMLLA